MRTAIQVPRPVRKLVERTGNSVTVTVSPVFLGIHGLKAGDRVRQYVDSRGRLVIEPEKE